MQREFLTVEQAAAALGVTVRRVRALILAERLPAEKIGRDWMIRPAALRLEHIKNRKPGRPKKL
jgi:excisionase family DNA binding protein